LWFLAGLGFLRLDSLKFVNRRSRTVTTFVTRLGGKGKVAVVLLLIRVARSTRPVPLPPRRAFIALIVGSISVTIFMTALGRGKNHWFLGK